jgi:flavin reductase (DIM6/NTAB) family NADH-FMN oxidoreductase RutF
MTAGQPGNRAGLTVSSVMIAEGEPSRLMTLVGDTTDLWFAIERSRSWVVHILGADDRELSDRFAGLRPSPGGPFSGLTVEETTWGPVVQTSGPRAYCRLEHTVGTGYHRLITGVIDRIDLHDLQDPLVYYRGKYRTLHRPSSVDPS